jgi:hypothetical protein
MVTAVASRPLTKTPSLLAPELIGLATCPACHTADRSMTNLAVSVGADWQCVRCGSRWDAGRLATVAAYAEWLSERAASPSLERTTQAGGLA